ncbi:MAG: Ig-like domain-containing protein [Bacteroidales bacterium]|nr:Ig-like domain-containing protein [Bacteroidales bacterium]MDD3988535.1 Ig-like domain-containing protein [Bacteroidales bacterium]
MKNRLAVLFLILIIVIFGTGSCANTSAPPSGGPRDTIPPVLIKVIPDSNVVAFPLQKGSVELKFDEYVLLKDPVKNIFLSPPLKKRVETKIRGKSLIVSFPEKLDSNITYSLHFGSSITDNNEGNQFYPYVFVFSTGSTTDSLMQSGVVLDCRTLLPAEDVTVGYYSDMSDSAVYNRFPDAMSKSDKWGYFVVRNLKSIPYQVFAFKDENGNNLFDPDNELVAFRDSLAVPTSVMRKESQELLFVDMKDTTKALARPSETVLYLFREKSAVQFVRESKRPGRRFCYIKFGAPDVKIDSMGFRELDSSGVLRQFNIARDSLALWIADTLYRVPDTLYFDLKYYKSDSLGNPALEREELKFIAKREKPVAQTRREEAARGVDLPRTDLMKLKIEASGDLIEQRGFVFIFPAPPVVMNLDSVMLESKSPRGIKSKEKYSFERDTLDLTRYYLRPENQIQQGYDYKLSVKKAAFKDLYLFTNDSLESVVSLPNSDRLAKLTLDISGVSGSYLVELTNQTRNEVFRGHRIERDTSIVFPYIKPGKYNIRITEDLNGNGVIDTGSILQKKQPEKVRLYSLPVGSPLIEFKEGMELIQSIDLKEIFK